MYPALPRASWTRFQLNIFFNFISHFSRQNFVISWVLWVPWVSWIFFTFLVMIWSPTFDYSWTLLGRITLFWLIFYHPPVLSCVFSRCNFYDFSKKPVPTCRMPPRNPSRKLARPRESSPLSLHLWWLCHFFWFAVWYFPSKLAISTCSKVATLFPEELQVFSCKQLLLFSHLFKALSFVYENSLHFKFPSYVERRFL